VDQPERAAPASPSGRPGVPAVSYPTAGPGRCPVCGRHRRELPPIALTDSVLVCRACLNEVPTPPHTDLFCLNLSASHGSTRS
jgi:hypothetical protein